MKIWFSLRCEKLKMTRKIPISHIIQAIKELVVLLESGMVLFQAIQLVAKRQKDEGHRDAWRHIASALQGGQSFSAAVALITPPMPPMLPLLIAAGEKAGNLVEVLKRFVHYEDERRNQREQLVQAAVYPAILMLTLVGVIGFVFGWVMPRFEEFYADQGQNLPLLTQAFLDIGAAAKQAFPYITIGVVGLTGFSLWAWFGKQKNTIELILLKIPLFGIQFRDGAIQQWLFAVGTLVIGGVPLVESLASAESLVSLNVFREQLHKIRTSILGGKQFSDALKEHMGQYMDSLVLAMIAVGEESGKLGVSLQDSAREIERQTLQRAKWIQAIGAPLLLLVMALLVALVLLALYLPLFDLSGVNL